MSLLRLAMIVSLPALATITWGPFFGALIRSSPPPRTIVAFRPPQLGFASDSRTVRASATSTRPLARPLARLSFRRLQGLVVRSKKCDLSSPMRIRSREAADASNADTDWPQVRDFDLTRKQ